MSWELYLGGNSIGDAGATQLADALRANTSVNKLFLGGNSIGDAGATQLADALRTNTSVALAPPLVHHRESGSLGPAPQRLWHDRGGRHRRCGGRGDRC